MSPAPSLAFNALALHRGGANAGPKRGAACGHGCFSEGSIGREAKLSVPTLRVVSSRSESAVVSAEARRSLLSAVAHVADGYFPVRFSMAWMINRLFITHVPLSNPILAQTSM